MICVHVYNLEMYNRYHKFNTCTLTSLAYNYRSTYSKELTLLPVRPSGGDHIASCVRKIKTYINIVNTHTTGTIRARANYNRLQILELHRHRDNGIQLCFDCGRLL